MTTTEVWYPTPEACESVGLKRFPSAYGSDNVNSKAVQDRDKNSQALGVQYTKWGDSNYSDSLRNLEVPDRINTRDIMIEVLTNRPFKIKTETKNGITTSIYDYGPNVPEPEYRIHISPTKNGELELEIKHEHQWSSGKTIFDKILAGAANLIGNVGDFITRVENIKNGSTNGDEYKTVPSRRVDTVETYDSSNKPGIIIPFTLFTPGGEANFLRDINTPIKLLERISYPKRSTNLGSLDQFVSKIVGVKKDAPNTSGTTANGQEPTDAENASTLDAVNAINPGFRVFVSDPPSYVNVKHNGGLFYYRNCYIKNFSYVLKYFVDGDGDSLKLSRDVDPILQSYARNSSKSYPLVAECTIELQSTEPLFADDFATVQLEREKGIEKR
jgi:hypothetical protein